MYLKKPCHNRCIIMAFLFLVSFTRPATKWIKVKQGHSFPCHWWMSDLFLKRLTTTEVALSCAVSDRLQPGSQTLLLVLSTYRLIFIDVDQLMHLRKLKLRLTLLLNLGNAFYKKKNIYCVALYACTVKSGRGGPIPLPVFSNLIIFFNN